MDPPSEGFCFRLDIPHLKNGKNLEPCAISRWAGQFPPKQSNCTGIHHFLTAYQNPYGAGEPSCPGPTFPWGQGGL